MIFIGKEFIKLKLRSKPVNNVYPDTLLPLTPCQADEWFRKLVCWVPIQIARAENHMFLLLCNGKEK